MKVEKSVMVDRDFFEIKRVFWLARKAEEYKSSIRWCKHNSICNGKSILGLVTFFLTLKKEDVLLLAIEGEDAPELMQLILSSIESACNPEIDYWEETAIEELKLAVDTRVKSKLDLRQIAKSYIKIC